MAALDESGDTRLGLRELRAAPARLAALDKDGDQTVSLAEIDDQITLELSHGGSPYASKLVIVLSPGPQWFVRMDRNGDGDLSPREWVGSIEEFKKLDKDGDGLIDVNEGRSAAR